MASTQMKVQKLGQDLNLNKKDILDAFAKVGINDKTQSSEYTADEFNLVLTSLLVQKSIGNKIEKYIARELVISSAKDETVPEKKPEEKVEKVKTPEVKEDPKAQVKSEQQKPVVKDRQQSNQNVNNTNTQKVNESTNKPNNVNKPVQNNNNKQKNQNSNNQQNFNRPQQSQQQKNVQKTFDKFAKPSFENKKVENKPQEKKIEKQEQKQTITMKPTNNGGIGATVEKKTRVVDTRTTQVDLSKYDEKLDSYSDYSKRNEKSFDRQKIKQKKNDNYNKKNKDKDKDRQNLEMLKREQMEKAKKAPLKVTLPEEIMVSDLASKLKVTSAEVVKKLMLMGVMAAVNQTIDYDTAYLIADEFGAEITKEVVVTIEEKLFEDIVDKEEDLVERDPVVCVMGHVDHGKTSLLDAIRHTKVTAGEAGGITQAIGAYRVNCNGKNITFLDTPGHAAFTAMRARGASSTDIAILVVAADDGIMPQTIEAINHAKAAKIPIIVAINKMDKPTANPDQVKQQLTQYELVPEEWGGDTICVPVSALTHKGIPELLEMVLLVAEVNGYKANPNRKAKGVIIEARLDKGRGPVATVLVQNGTLNSGDIVIAGTSVGRVRAMIDDNGKQVKVAGPSVPVEIVGLDQVPQAGDEFNSVEDERMARTLAEQRKTAEKEEIFKAHARANLDALFTQIKEGVKDLNIIVKADVKGSVEAVNASLEKLTNDEVKVQVIHSAVGGINEGDVNLAAASNAIIVGFNVRPDKQAIDSAENQKVDIRTYRVIYECIEEIEAAIKGMLKPEFKEVILGHAEVRQTIHISSIGTIAGSYVQDGKITRQSQIRVVRDGIVIFEDKISSLKRFKEDVKEVASRFECGIGLEKFNDIKEGDILEAFVIEEIART